MFQWILVEFWGSSLNDQTVTWSGYIGDGAIDMQLQPSIFHLYLSLLSSNHNRRQAELLDVSNQGKGVNCRSSWAPNKKMCQKPKSF